MIFTIFRRFRNVSTFIIAAHKSIRIGVLFALLILISACAEDDESPVIVTQVVMENEQEIIVTRVIRQKIEIEVTPVVEFPEDPVVLDISTVGGYSSLDPQLMIVESALDVIENILIGLTRFDHRNNRVEPMLADNWQVSNSGRRWTFNLRDDIYWISHRVQEGGLRTNSSSQLTLARSVTAHDVVFAVRRACDPRVATPDIFILFIIEGCKAVNELSVNEVDEAVLASIGVTAEDDQTVVFDLTEPSAHFLTLTTLPILRPLPIERVQEQPEEWHLPGNIVTSGPFVLSPETLTGSRTVLDRNPYWPIEFTGNLDHINIHHLDDEVDAFRLWEDRSLDLSPVPIEDQTNILSRHGPKANLVSNQEVFYLAYNFDSSVFSIPEVRRAFAWAIDRDRLVREIHGGRGLPMRHFGPQGVIGAPPIEEVGTGYSPDRARREMDNSPFGDCRLMPPVRYMISSSDIALQQAELLRDMWMTELGCKEDQIIIEQVRFGTLLANTRPDAGAIRPDIWDLGWASYFPDEQNWLGDVLHCTDSENRQLRPCETVDNQIHRANGVMLVEERWELYRQIERNFFGEQAIEPISPLYVRADYMLRQSWVNYTPAHFGGEHFDTYFLEADVKELERNR